MHLIFFLFVVACFTSPMFTLWNAVLQSLPMNSVRACEWTLRWLTEASHWNHLVLTLFQSHCNIYWSSNKTSRRKIFFVIDFHFIYIISNWVRHWSSMQRFILQTLIILSKKPSIHQENGVWNTILKAASIALYLAHSELFTQRKDICKDRF